MPGGVEGQEVGPHLLAPRGDDAPPVSPVTAPGAPALGLDTLTSGSIFGAAWTDEKKRMGRKSKTGFVHRAEKQNTSSEGFEQKVD